LEASFFHCDSTAARAASRCDLSELTLRGLLDLFFLRGPPACGHALLRPGQSLQCCIQPMMSGSRKTFCEVDSSQTVLSCICMCGAFIQSWASPRTRLLEFRWRDQD
jgi:hypothetical protein